MQTVTLDQPDTPWMTTEEAAEYLGVATGTLRNLVSMRRIPFARRGRIVRFHRERLDAWLLQGGTLPCVQHTGTSTP